MKGTSKPDYGQCVDIATKAALKEMVLPGLLVVGMPVAVGLVFRWLFIATGQPVGGASGAEVVGGLLMVGTIVGILMALFLNNGGGAWTMQRNTSSPDILAANGRSRTRRPWWATRWVTRSRTRRGPRCTCS